MSVRRKLRVESLFNRAVVMANAILAATRFRRPVPPVGFLAKRVQRVIRWLLND